MCQGMRLYVSPALPSCIFARPHVCVCIMCVLCVCVCVCVCSCVISDGDGILDVLEGYLDLDEDGVPNFLDTDSDGANPQNDPLFDIPLELTLFVLILP